MCLYVVYRFRAIYTFLFLYRWQILLKGGTLNIFAVTVFLHLGAEKPEKLWQEAR